MTLVAAMARLGPVAETWYGARVRHIRVTRPLLEATAQFLNKTLPGILTISREASLNQ